MTVVVRSLPGNLDGLGNLEGLVGTALIHTRSQVGKMNTMTGKRKVSWIADHRIDQDLPSGEQTHKTRVG